MGNDYLLNIEDNPANVRLVRKTIARHSDLELIDAPTAENGIAVRADAMPEQVAAAREAGLDEYLTKPPDILRFKTPIDNLLKEREQ